MRHPLCPPSYLVQQPNITRSKLKKVKLQQRSTSQILDIFNKDMYVDNLITGTDIQEALQLPKENKRSFMKISISLRD